MCGKSSGQIGICGDHHHATLVELSHRVTLRTPPGQASSQSLLKDVDMQAIQGLLAARPGQPGQRIEVIMPVVYACRHLARGMNVRLVTIQSQGRTNKAQGRPPTAPQPRHPPLTQRIERRNVGHTRLRCHSQKACDRTEQHAMLIDSRGDRESIHADWDKKRRGLPGEAAAKRQPCQNISLEASTHEDCTFTEGEMSEHHRCRWANGDPLMSAYHDDEWGVPEYDSRALWEKLMLDGFQAGLSWRTILYKRDAFRTAFAGFDPERVARFDHTDVDRLMQDAGIVRARAKIEATIGNARAYLAMQAAGEDFSTWVWGQVGDKPIVNLGPIQTQSPLSLQMSKALKKRGFKFVGPVIVYAWMQAVGIVDDHEPGCFRRTGG